MTDPLGLSIGATNLAAVRSGRPPLLSPSPLAVVHGSVPRGAEPVAAALDELARRAGCGEPVWIAVPAHWGPDLREAVRIAVLTQPGLTPGGAAPVLVTDAAASVATLRAAPGRLPTGGIVALCDFGGSGTSITLADAAANFTLVSHTVRYVEFGGERVDREIVNRLIADRREMRRTDSGATTAVETLARLREDCRAAKERLSDQPETTVPVELPGFSGELRLTRDEVEAVAAPLLSGVARAVAETLAANRIAPANLSAVAAVGGVAAMPMVAAHLSQRLRVPVITVPQPGFAASTGAALLAGEPPTATSMNNVRPGLTADTPTGMASTAWAAGAAAGGSADVDASATFRALAWSQDDSSADEPVAYSGADYPVQPRADQQDAVADAPAADVDLDWTDAEAAAPFAWYKRPAVLFGLAAALALAATGGLAYTLTGTSGPGITTVTTGAPAPPSASDSPPPPAPGPPGTPAPAPVPPPAPAPAPAPPEDTTTTAAPTPTTTTTAPTTTTTTTTVPATTTTSAPPSTTEPATTTAPHTTTEAPTTTIAPTTTVAPTQPKTAR